MNKFIIILIIIMMKILLMDSFLLQLQFPTLHLIIFRDLKDKLKKNLNDQKSNLNWEQTVITFINFVKQMFVVGLLNYIICLLYN